MRVLLALIVVAAVALTVVPGAAAKRSCAQRGSKTVQSTEDVRVFTAPAERGSDELVLSACLKADGRKRKLAQVETDRGVDTNFSAFDSVRVAGSYVAWHSYRFEGGCKADCPPGYDYTRDSLLVYDLRRRRTTLNVDVPGVTARSLALTQNGGLAWLVPILPLGTQQLTVADRDGTRVLDSGAIDPASVGAEISIVSWVRDGVEHFARLR